MAEPVGVDAAASLAMGREVLAQPPFGMRPGTELIALESGRCALAQGTIAPPGGGNGADS